MAEPQTPQQKMLLGYQNIQQKIKEQILAAQQRSKNLHHQEKAILTQIAAALGGSLAIVILYIFVIFPLLVRFAGNLGSLTAFNQTDTIPPRVPAYEAPNPATQEDHISITGFGEPKSKIIVVKNGSESEKTDVNGDGQFTLDVHLDEGKNTLALYSIDAAKNDSPLGKEYTVSFDKTPPEITIDTPEDNKTVKNLREKIIDIKGKVNEQVKVYVNDRFVPTGAENTFSTTFSLADGQNDIVIKAVDLAGNEKEEKRTVFFKP